MAHGFTRLCVSTTHNCNEMHYADAVPSTVGVTPRHHGLTATCESEKQLSGATRGPNTGIHTRLGCLVRC